MLSASILSIQAERAGAVKSYALGSAGARSRRMRLSDATLDHGVADPRVVAPKPVRPKAISAASETQTSAAEATMFASAIQLREGGDPSTLV